MPSANRRFKVDPLSALYNCNLACIAAHGSMRDYLEGGSLDNGEYERMSHCLDRLAEWTFYVSRAKPKPPPRKPRRRAKALPDA